MEFTARRTAIFTDGKFKGILDERQSFALAILKEDIRLAVLPCDAEGTHYTLGLKNVKGGISLKINDGVPMLEIKVSASAQIQGARVVVQPSETANDDVVSEHVLKGANEEMQERIAALLKTVKENDCDILGVKELLYKYHTKYFEAFKDDLLSRMQVACKVDIFSVN